MLQNRLKGTPEQRLGGEAAIPCVCLEFVDPYSFLLWQKGSTVCGNDLLEVVRKWC